MPAPARRRLERALGRDQRGERELALELLAPLTDEARGREHQPPGGEPAQAQLAQHKAGLDRLAEPNLVGENRAALHVTEDPARGLELVGERLEAQPRKAHEGVKARARPHPQGLVDELGSPWRHREAGLELVQEDAVGLEQRRLGLGGPWRGFAALGA